MANEWIHSNGAACYSSASAGFALSQNNVLEIGKTFIIEFTISNMTQGKLVLDSLNKKPKYFKNGTYRTVGKSDLNNLTFIGKSYKGKVFNGCISMVSAKPFELMQ